MVVWFDKLLQQEGIFVAIPNLKIKLMLDIEIVILKLDRQKLENLFNINKLKFIMLKQKGTAIFLSHTD